MSYILIINRVFKRADVGGLWGCKEGSLNEHGAVLEATRALARLTRIETYVLFKVIQLNVKFIRTINNFKTLVARIITEFVFNFGRILLCAFYEYHVCTGTLNRDFFGLFLQYLFFFLFSLPTKSPPASVFLIPSIA